MSQAVPAPPASVSALLAVSDLADLISVQALGRAGVVPKDSPAGKQLRKLLASPVAESTIRQYLGPLKRYSEVVRTENLPATNLNFPIPLTGLWAYISAMSLVNEMPTIEQNLSALDFWHRVLGYDWPARQDAGTKALLATIRSQPRKHPMKQATPIAFQDLLTIRSQLDLAKPGHAIFWVICCLAFHGLFRIGELTLRDASPESLRKAVLLSGVEVTVAATMLPYHPGTGTKVATSVRQISVYLPRPKGFDPSTPTTVRMEETFDATCPVEAWLNYVRVCGPTGRFAFSWPSGELPSRAWFLASLQNFLPWTRSSGHSFRSGGAIRLVGLGFPVEILKGHGRWNDDTWHRYVRHNMRFWSELKIRYRFLEGGRPLAPLLEL